MSDFDLNWQGIDFSEDFLSGLNKLQMPRELSLPQPLSGEELTKIAERHSIPILKNRFPKFYMKWHNCVMQVMRSTDLDELRKSLAYYYARCNKDIELLVAGYEAMQIWVSPHSFAFEIDGQRQEFEMNPEKIQESVQPFASALARNRMIIRGMHTDPEAIVSYVKEQNTDELHVKRCFSRFIDLFIATAQRINIATYATYTDIERLKLGGERGEQDRGVKVFDKQGIKIYWAFDRIIVSSTVDQEENIRQVPIAEPEKVKKLKEVLRPLALVLFKELPITDQQIIQAVFAA